MARTKKTARVDRNPKLAEKAASTRNVPGKSVDRMRQMRGRRYDQHKAVLSELRRVQRHIQAAIPRLPFNRVVRDICDNYNIGLRWQSVALATLQEACEDWMIEFFQDAYVLTAHAHRITMMPRDLHSLRLLRFRYDSLLNPCPLTDIRMDNILSVPPLKRVPKVQVEDVTEAAHSRLTRSTHGRDGADPIVEEPEETQPVNAEASQVNVLNLTRELLRERRNAFTEELGYFLPEFNVTLSIRGAEQYFQFDIQDIAVLRERDCKVNDSVMVCLLRWE